VYTSEITVQKILKSNQHSSVLLSASRALFLRVHPQNSRLRRGDAAQAARSFKQRRVSVDGLAWVIKGWTGAVDGHHGGGRTTVVLTEPKEK